MMSKRDRLIELAMRATLPLVGNSLPASKQLEMIADNLFENGVILSPCKVGDAVWFLHLKDEIAEGVVDSIEISRYSAPEVFISVEYEDRFGEIHCRSWEENAIGKTLFFSREAAEAALAHKKEGKK